jgi:thiol-disulfide isomerase/thioredoxin
MRILFGTTLLLLLFCLTGCNSTQKGGSGSTGQPFTGLPAPGPARSGAPAASSSEAGATGNGILAGQVLDRYRGRAAGVPIQVVDLQEKDAPGAAIKAYADDQGYFYIPGLKAGHNYQLIAEQKDGSRVLVATAQASPPNARLALYLSEDNGQPRTGTAIEPDRTRTSGPAATIQPPVRATPEAERSPSGPDNRGAGGASGALIVPPMRPTNPTPIDPTRTATIQDGFARQPNVSIPGPWHGGQERPQGPAGLTIPPPPSSGGAQGQGNPARATPAPGPASPTPLPANQTPVPSCVLVGKKLENFALYNLNGDPWIWQRDRSAGTRVVLLDFWFTTCDPCLRGIKHLRELQSQYGPQGLQVVGIAEEQAGTRAEQIQRVISARARNGINYVTLLGGGGPGPCPVMTQFRVDHFPTLILLDDQGNILWRHTGALDAQMSAELDHIIRQQLGLVRR